MNSIFNTQFITAKCYYFGKNFNEMSIIIYWCKIIIRYCEQ